MEETKLNNLLKIEEELGNKEEEFDNCKLELEILEADYQLENDWEKIFGKAKVTQKEKDAYVVKEIEVRKRNLKRLEREVKHLRRMFDIYMTDAKH